MANTTVYPFGEGQMPSGIGIINDLTTGGANNALSAEQGKVLKEMIDDAMPLSFTMTNGKVLRRGGTLADDNNFAISDEIDITDYKKVLISTNLWYSSAGPTYDAVVCVYDENGTFLREAVDPRLYSQTSGIVAIENVEYEVQEGDSYIILCNQKTGSVTPSVKGRSHALTWDEMADALGKHVSAVTENPINTYAYYANTKRMFGTFFVADYGPNMKVTVRLKDSATYKVSLALATFPMTNWATPDIEDTGWQVGFEGKVIPSNAATVQVRFAKDGGWSADTTTEDVEAILDAFYIEYDAILTTIDDNITSKRYVDTLVDNEVGGLISQVRAISLNGSSPNVHSVNHRGFNTIAPENTMPAFIESVRQGFSMVETDVAFTSDGVAVLLHDNSINRTARNADGSAISGTVNINSITYEQALEYDFGIWKGTEYAGVKIPTLREFCLLCRAVGVHPYIELKNTTAIAQVTDVVNIVNSCGMNGKVTYISFNGNLLNAIKTLDTKARLGCLVTGELSAQNITFALNLRTDENDVFISSSSLTDASVNLCKDAGIPYEVWTIDSASTVLSLNPYITGVTSDNINAASLLFNTAIEQ